MTASMGPRPFGRGMRRWEERCASGSSASMGPRPFGRGMNSANTWTPIVHMLQWGRDLSVAECGRHDFYVDAERRASMGPRPFGRGMLVYPETIAGDPSASMGPRPFGRGMQVRNQPCDDPQKASMGPRPFGRGMRIPTAKMPTMTNTLQWGRDLSVAE